MRRGDSGCWRLSSRSSRKRSRDGSRSSKRRYRLGMGSLRESRLPVPGLVRELRLPVPLGSCGWCPLCGGPCMIYVGQLASRPPGLWE